MCVCVCVCVISNGFLLSVVELLLPCYLFSDYRLSNWSAFNDTDMMNQHLQNTTNTSIRSVTDNKLQGGGHLPLYGLVLYVLLRV